MVVQKTGVLKINYCDCNGCRKLLAELRTFLEVQQIVIGHPEKHMASILVTGDPDQVTKTIEKHGKKCIGKSPPMNNHGKPLPTPPKRSQVVAQPPGNIKSSTIVKKTKVCCPKCNHELELKKFDKRFACDGCKEDGFGSRYRCKDCDYSLHKECASPKPTISPDFLQGSAFEFCHQPCSTRLCYACGQAIRGYFYRCKSKGLHLHPYCSNLKRNLCGMDFVHRDKEISSSSKCVCCEKKMRSGSCSYISTSEKYHVHVYCITEMLHEAWKKGVTDEKSMPAGEEDLQLRKPNNSNRSGGRLGEIVKALSTFLVTIFGIFLGGPIGPLLPVVHDFSWIMLLKLLSK